MDDRGDGARRRRGRLAAVAAMAITVWMAASSVTASAESVAVKSFAYSPNPVTVWAGGTVTWTNQDPVAHDVKFGDGWQRDLPKGASTSRTFDQAGTFSYSCTLHSGMAGTVVVQAAATTTTAAPATTAPPATAPPQTAPPTTARPAATTTAAAPGASTTTTTTAPGEPTTTAAGGAVSSSTTTSTTSADAGDDPVITPTSEVKQLAASTRNDGGGGGAGLALLAVIGVLAIAVGAWLLWRRRAATEPPPA